MHARGAIAGDVDGCDGSGDICIKSANSPYGACHGLWGTSVNDNSDAMDRPGRDGCILTTRAAWSIAKPAIVPLSTALGQLLRDSTQDHFGMFPDTLTSHGPWSRTLTVAQRNVNVLGVVSSHLRTRRLK